MNKRILLASPHMSDDKKEKYFVNQSFLTNWIAPLGPNVNGFENELAKIVDIKSAAALSSGTSAIHMALIASDVKEGDKVICQSLTFSATANPIIYQKAIPIFVDSDNQTWNISPILLEKALSENPETKAVLIVHLYGIPANLNQIIAICKKYNVTLIEDAAESLGSLYENKYTGTFGDYGIYSFNGNKIITTSGGGMLVSNNTERIEKVRFWSTQARDKARHYQHSELGYNYRMSNIVAGVGRGQLTVLQKRVEKKREIFFRYIEGLKDIKEISFMPNNENTYQNCWLSSILVSGKIKPIDIILALEKENIESRNVWKPMHLQPFFKDYKYYGTGVSDDLFDKGVCLPSDTKMTVEEQDRVIKVIRGLFIND